jgi:hypothetical protein
VALTDSNGHAFGPSFSLGSHETTTFDYQTTVNASYTNTATATADGQAPVTSSARAIVVAPSATVPTTTRLIGPCSARARHRIELRGTVAPSAAPGSVTIAITRLVCGRWRSIDSVSIALADGAFSYKFAPATEGTWGFVATYSGGTLGSTTYESSQSGLTRVTVKRSPPPRRHHNHKRRRR